MRDTIHIILAFIFALIGTFFMINSPLYSLFEMRYLNEEIILSLTILILIIFSKRIAKGMKKLNRYSWLIIIFYLSGTLTMESLTYNSSVHFEGIYITLPIVLAFIYWSQKTSNILFMSGSKTKKSDRFKIDLFLITTSFLLAGLLSLIMDLNNIDLRGFWPFLIILISVYGFFFSAIYSISGLISNKNHKNYTLIFASSIILIFSLLRFFPKNIRFSNLIEIESFYALSIILLLINLVLMFVFYLKERMYKR